jgi:hypothetical protein
VAYCGGGWKTEANHTLVQVNKDGVNTGEANAEVRGHVYKMGMAKQWLGPLAGESGGVIPSGRNMEAMLGSSRQLALSTISFHE